MRILLVEDNELNRDMLTRRLQRRGFICEQARNGLEAIDVAQSLLPDVIVMDMSLPIMDGWEATRQIKSQPATSHIPVIGLSAHAMVEDRMRGMKSGCEAYFTKPVDFEALIRTLETLCRKESMDG